MTGRWILRDRTVAGTTSGASARSRDGDARHRDRIVARDGGSGGPGTGFGGRDGRARRRCGVGRVAEDGLATRAGGGGWSKRTGAAKPRTCRSHGGGCGESVRADSGTRDSRTTNEAKPHVRRRRPRSGGTNAPPPQGKHREAACLANPGSRETRATRKATHRVTRPGERKPPAPPEQSRATRAARPRQPRTPRRLTQRMRTTAPPDPGNPATPVPPGPGNPAAPVPSGPATTGHRTPPPASKAAGQPAEAAPPSAPPARNRCPVRKSRVPGRCPASGTAVPGSAPASTRAPAGPARTASGSS